MMRIRQNLRSLINPRTLWGRAKVPSQARCWHFHSYTEDNSHSLMPQDRRVCRLAVVGNSGLGTHADPVPDTHAGPRLASMQSSSAHDLFSVVTMLDPSSASAEPGRVTCAATRSFVHCAEYYN